MLDVLEGLGDSLYLFDMKKSSNSIQLVFRS